MLSSSKIAVSFVIKQTSKPKKNKKRRNKS